MVESSFFLFKTPLVLFSLTPRDAGVWVFVEIVKDADICIAYVEGRRRVRRAVLRSSCHSLPTTDGFGLGCELCYPKRRDDATTPESDVLDPYRI
jgi:hypothetical protein